MSGRRAGKSTAFYEMGRLGLAVAAGGRLMLRTRMKELAAAGFETTCRGEAEQGRTWSGEELLCGRCGERIPPHSNNCGCKGGKRGRK